MPGNYSGTAGGARCWWETIKSMMIITLVLMMRTMVGGFHEKVGTSVLICRYWAHYKCPRNISQPSSADPVGGLAKKYFVKWCRKINYFLNNLIIGLNKEQGAHRESNLCLGQSLTARWSGSNQISTHLALQWNCQQKYELLLINRHYKECLTSIINTQSSSNAPFSTKAASSLDTLGNWYQLHFTAMSKTQTNTNAFTALAGLIKGAWYKLSKSISIER